MKSTMLLSRSLMRYCIQLNFGVLKISLYSPVGGYLCYTEFAHSSTQQSKDTKPDIYL